MAVAWLYWGMTWCSAFWPIAGRLSSEASQYSELTCTRTLSQTTLLHAHSCTVTAPNAPDMPCTKQTKDSTDIVKPSTLLSICYLPCGDIHLCTLQRHALHVCRPDAIVGCTQVRAGMCCTCSMGCTPLCGPRTARSPAGQGHRQCCA